MDCSHFQLIQTVVVMASLSTTKSGSNWLDRLRSSRGFPTGDDPDLDRFLSTSSSGSAPTTATGSTHSESTQSQPAIRELRNSGGRNDVGEASNVLCDLFNMGEGSSRSFSKKKGSRKQANPRFCGSNENNNELCSSDDLRRDKSENGLASSGDNSLNETREKNAAKFDVEGEEREDVDVDVDLKAYSRSEVYVIDTSLPDWKFDGWVFRKNDEWKIKEKKGKSRVFGGKKRKLLMSTLNNDKSDKDDQKKKMMKMDNNEEGFLPLSKEQHKNDKNEQSFKVTTDSLGKVPQKRCPCPRPPDKFGNEGSSVVLLKSIPLSNSSGAPILGKSSHKKRLKQMKVV